MLYLYMEQIMKCYCQSRAASHAKLCWFQNQTCSFWLRSAQDWTLENFFWWISKCSCWWEMFILQKTAEPWISKRSSWVMTDDVSFEWAFYKLQSGVQLQAARWLFSTDERCVFLIPSRTPSTSCQALLKFIECWSCSTDWGCTSCSQVFELWATWWLFSRQMKGGRSFPMPWRKIPTAV